ncbi:MAG: DUF1800 domain-containing protein [Chloroflexi bacterium]|nr:DUF1800 domain-containing protein [Chloroflexota bacterium]
MSKSEIELMAHLMRRAGFGATRGELEEYVAQGYEATVEELLSDVVDRQTIPDDILRRYHVDIEESRIGGAATYWMYRMITTRRPLEEKIALFWHSIFATGYSKIDQGMCLTNQIETFRRHGLGRFDNLLVELSRDPAMIIWLDNDYNHGGAINENYGRELLELFSMGIGNYTEEDIKECARAFTGWTLGNAGYMGVRARKNSIWPYGRIAWHFERRDDDHDDGDKTFLGETGRFDGEDVIAIICRQPATARFVARHICDYFLADEAPVPQWAHTPPQNPDAIEMLVDTYFESDHDIRSMLRTLFNSDLFKESRFTRIKSPAELLVGTLRLSGGISEPSLQMNETATLAGYMGQDLLNPTSVEGWHEGTEWIHSGPLVQRVNFASTQMSDLDRPGFRDILDRLGGQNGGVYSPERLVDSCLDLMGPIPASETTRSALVQHVAETGDVSLKKEGRDEAAERLVAELLGLIASTREYQLA